MNEKNWVWQGKGHLTFPSLCATRRDILRVRSCGGRGDLSYLIFLGRLGLAMGSSGLRLSCCGVEASTSSIVSSSLRLGWLEGNVLHWFCRDCVLSSLPGKGPSSVPVFCWQASFVSLGGSVTSSNEGSDDPSNVLLQGG